MADETKVWWRNLWMESIYSSDLKPMERLIAAVYADHAGNQRLSWVTLPRLAERSGLGRSQAQTWRRRLVDKGWLVEVQKARQQKAAVYLLAIPEGSSMPGDRQPVEDSSVPTTREPAESRVPGSDAQGAGIQPSGCRPTGTNPFPDPSTHPSSSSRTPAQKHLARLLRWPEEDERLDLLDDFLNSRTPAVQKAIGWMNSCHEAGDLERNFLGFVKAQTSSWSGLPTVQDLRRIEAERDEQEEQQRAWRRDAPQREKCPNCNAPQEITHYPDCPDKAWAPTGVDPALMSNLCSRGCGPFVRWHGSDGPKCRVCAHIQYQEERSA